MQGVGTSGNGRFTCGLFFSYFDVLGGTVFLYGNEMEMDVFERIGKSIASDGSRKSKKKKQ